MKILLLILARHGSVRLPKKNSRVFNGKKSLFDVTYNFCQKRKDFGKWEFDILVSSNDPVINASLKNQTRYTYDYVRPDRLSGAGISSNETAIDAIDWYTRNVGTFGYCILLQPTSPLRTHLGMDRFLNGLKNKEMCYASISPLNIKKSEIVLMYNESFNPVFEEGSSLEPSSSQLFFEDGAYYSASFQYIGAKRKIFDPKDYRYIFAEENFQIDVDTYEDFLLAKCLFRQRNLDK